jgi:hypothetical protein
LSAPAHPRYQLRKSQTQCIYLTPDSSQAANPIITMTALLY